MSEKSFACAINCMDGRTQEPVIAYLKKKLGVDYVDAVTEPGPILHLAEGTPLWVNNIKACCDISVEKHHAQAIAIVSHYDCAGNPVPKEIQMDHLRKAVIQVRSWYPAIPIFGVWVDDSWTVHEVIADYPEA